MLFQNVSQSYARVTSRHLPQMIFHRSTAHALVPLRATSPRSLFLTWNFAGNHGSTIPGCPPNMEAFHEGVGVLPCFHRNRECE